MRLTAAVCAAIALGACADQNPIVLDDIRDARGELPGVQTEINCSRAPRIIYDKQGEIIDMIHPILHPTCLERERELQREADRLAEFGLNRHATDNKSEPNPTIASLQRPAAQAHDHDTPHTDDGHTHDHNEPHDHHDGRRDRGTPPTNDLADHDGDNCTDPDSCHTHLDHNPALHDNEHERRTIHGLNG